MTRAYLALRGNVRSPSFSGNGGKAPFGRNRLCPPANTLLSIYLQGLAFQIVDDLLDFVGTSLVLGKPALADLNQVRMLTLPKVMPGDNRRAPGGRLPVCRFKS